MAQQTPVARVEPVWRIWLDRWPTPAALAAESPGEAVRAWGRLGYPRRALRLHHAAADIVERFGGEVPASSADLLTLPGVGEYTAAAVACFAFGEPTVVIDTNIRRVLARTILGHAFPAPTVTAAERTLARAAQPARRADAVTWNVAAMELGALVCSARVPRCDGCPVSRQCAWFRAGRPEHDGPPRRSQAWAGTDRQCRGALLAVIRGADALRGAHPAAIRAAWPERTQRQRCLAGLLDDGLVEALPGGGFRLPR
jgi:A/G-specific adenine glycosylase